VDPNEALFHAAEGNYDLMIVSLGLDRTKGKVTRYLQVEKMRACEHSMEKHAIEARRGGVSVLGPIFEPGPA